MSVTALKTAAEQALGAAFRAAEPSLPGAAPVKALRTAAIAAFERTGLPHRRIEAWHYTDLRSQWRDVKPFAGRPSHADLPPALLADSPRLALVDGHLVTDLSHLSLPAGIVVRSLASALASGDADVLAAIAGPKIAEADTALALNAAFMTDGVVISVDAGVAVSMPLELAHVVAGSARSTAARSVVILGKGASLGLVETVAIDGEGHQTSDVLHVVLGDGARFSHVRNAARDQSALALSTLTATLGHGSRLETFTLGTRAALSRRQYFVAYQGHDAHARVDGANILSGKTHSDSTLVVDHDSLRSESRELFRSVVDGEAKGVFQGKIIVRPGAQKTDGQMASNALLLSDRADMSNKPELEIFADDVLCAHGATCGAIDERSLFYLMSRGIPRPVAEAMMVRAFIAEVVERIGEEGPLAEVADVLHEALMAEVDAWAEARGA